METKAKGDRAQIAGITVLAAMILGIIITFAPRTNDIAPEFYRLDVMGSDD